MSSLLSRDDLLNQMFLMSSTENAGKLSKIIDEADAYLADLKQKREKDEQVQHLRNILGLWKIEAISKEVYHDLFKKASSAILRLNSLEKWDFTDIRIAARAVGFAKNGKVAVGFAKKALSQIDYFSSHEFYWSNKFAIHMETALALYRAKLHKKDGGFSQACLQENFMEHSEKALEICKSNLEMTAKYGAVIMYRIAMFFNDTRSSEDFDETEPTQIMNQDLRESEKLHHIHNGTQSPQRHKALQQLR